MATDIHADRPSVATMQRVLDGLRELPPSVGERNSSAKLTADKVHAIRVSYDAGADLATLAEAFGIHVRTARHIVQRTTWRHV